MIATDVRHELKRLIHAVKTGHDTKESALKQVNAHDIELLLHNSIESTARAEAIETKRLVARSAPISPGAVTAPILWKKERALAYANSGKPFIWAQTEITPDTLPLMLSATGLLMWHSAGLTSHSAIIARQHGIPCIGGVDQSLQEYSSDWIVVNNKQLEQEQIITIDGSSGEIFGGSLRIESPEFDKELHLLELLSWTEEFSRLKVRANADTAREASLARAFGASGIGICRTEHIVLSEAYRATVQKLLLAEPDSETEVQATQELLISHRLNLEELFQVMNGMPVIVRLLDLPLHEILPDHTPFREINPMLGMRGVRLGFMRPAIYEMQIRAIIEAACRVAKQGLAVSPEIMIPLVAYASELALMKKMVDGIAREVMSQYGIHIPYLFGTMIELPQAAILADELAEYAQFFSFGTNDLTQTTVGISRDDAEHTFLLPMLAQNLITDNPFYRLDEKSVGFLIKTATRLGRETRPSLEVGICGEHAGNLESIHFCHTVGLDYVSCSPNRIPLARLAAAQAAIHSSDTAQNVSH